MDISAGAPKSSGCRYKPRSLSDFNCSTGMRFASAHASWRIPVTCQETSTLGLSVWMMKRLFAISAGDHRLCELANRRELVTEVTVQSLKPLRHLNHCPPLPIRHYVAVVDIHHVRRFDKGVVEVFVGRIQGMVNLERAACFGEVAVHIHIAKEKCGEATAALCKQTIPAESLTAATPDPKRLCEIPSTPSGPNPFSEFWVRNSRP